VLKTASLACHSYSAEVKKAAISVLSNICTCQENNYLTLHALFSMTFEEHTSDYIEDYADVV
jgi:hypothetical protein